MGRVSNNSFNIQRMMLEATVFKKEKNENTIKRSFFALNDFYLDLVQTKSHQLGLDLKQMAKQ